MSSAAYLSVHGAADVARHAALLAPVPKAGEVRVVVTPARIAGQWCVDVAARDRPGLLASFTGGLAALEIDVVQAVIATWDDGAALEAFVVRSFEPPDPDDVRAALVAALDEPLASAPMPEAAIEFTAGEVYDACEVRAPDRPGLLHAVAAAFAAAGVDVHAASVTTRAGVAIDRFDVSRLDTETEAAVRVHLAGGVTPRRRFWSRRRRDRGVGAVKRLG